MLETMKKWAVLWCTALLLGTTLAVVSIGSTATPAMATPPNCAEFTVQSPVVQSVQWQGTRFVLLENGGIWAPCDQWAWQGDASNGGTGRQSYFVGRNARLLELCIRNYSGGAFGSLVGYRIVATSGETYMYGQNPWSGNGGCTYVRNLGGIDCPKFMPQRSIVHVTSHMLYNGPWYLLSGGGVWAPCGGWFGDASNGGTGSQSYFAGRKASVLHLCHTSNHSIVGYRIWSTSNESYNYGQTSGCSWIEGNNQEVQFWRY